MSVLNDRNPTKMAVAKTLKNSTIAELESLYSPLKKLGINAFFYSRFIGTKRINCMSNNFKWLEHLHDHILDYRKNFENQFHFRPGFSVDFLNMFSKEEMTVDMLEHEIKNAIYISNVAKDRKFSEVFIFTTAENPEFSSQKLLEKLASLNHFGLYFKEKAHKLIQDTQLKESEIKACDNSEPNFPLSNHESPFTEINKYYLGSPYDDIYLTKTQFLYVKEFLHGKSSKQIANLYSVSPRTVEKQIELVKRKLNCNTKNHLLETILYSPLFYPVFFQKN